MKKGYDYRHELLPDDPHVADVESGGIVRAAFKLAKLAHAGQSRKKIDPSIKYISHPIMAYDLMVRMGEHNPIVLAATLLHDALEDCPRFKKNPELMQRMLGRMLEREGYGREHAAAIAHRVQYLCQQVTNPDLRNESKTMMQMQHSDEMDFNAWRIKIADQTASLICALMMPDRNERPYAQREWANKAFNLVHYIGSLAGQEAARPDANAVVKQQHKEIQGWVKMFDDVYERHHDLTSASNEGKRARVRESFAKKLDKIVRMPRSIHVDYSPNLDTSITLDFPKETPPVDVIARGDMEEHMHPQFGGIAQAYLNDKGEVSAFTVWVDPHKSDKRPHNLLARYAVQVMVKADGLHGRGDDAPLQDEKARRVYVVPGEPQMIEVDGQQVAEGRLHYFHPPMNAMDFVERAVHACAISTDEATMRVMRLRRQGKEGLALPRTDCDASRLLRRASALQARNAETDGWAERLEGGLGRGGNATGR